MKVVQLTTVHSWDDTRIFHKIARSLPVAGFQVTLIAPGAPDSPSCDVSGISLSAVPNRLFRIAFRQIEAMKHIRKLKPDVVHFHDPELLPLGLLLRLFGQLVIYDAHEDVASQIMVKHWIARPLRPSVSMAFGLFEQWAARQMSGVIGATPKIASLLPRGVAIRNFPLLSEFSNCVAKEKIIGKQRVVYIGGISIERGIADVVESLSLTKSGVVLDLAGKFSSKETESNVRTMPGWSRVNYRGWIDRDEIAKTINSAQVGLLVLHPTPNHLDSLPIKLFEYFAAGIPIIASDFPLWRDLIGNNGLFVEPGRPEQIAAAIDWIFEHPAEASEMGKRGREKVETEWNWEQESKRLIEFYQKLIE